MNEENLAAEQARKQRARDVFHASHRDNRGDLDTAKDVQKTGGEDNQFSTEKDLPY